MALGTSGRRLHTVALPHADVRLLLGVVLVVVALVGGLSLWSQMRVTEPVVIAARAIPSGHVITAEDLALADARLEGPLAGLAIGEGARASLIGQTATAPIPAGAMVVRPALGTGPTIAPSETAITVPVEANAVFPGLRRGDRVGVFATSEQGRPQSLTTPLLDRAIVYDVSLEASRVSLGGSGANEGRITNVTILVPRDQAERVTHSLVNGRLTLVLVATEPVR